MRYHMNLFKFFVWIHFLLYNVIHYTMMMMMMMMMTMTMTMTKMKMKMKMKIKIKIIIAVLLTLSSLKIILEIQDLD